MLRKQRTATCRVAFYCRKDGPQGGRRAPSGNRRDSRAARGQAAPGRPRLDPSARGLPRARGATEQRARVELARRGNVGEVDWPALTSDQRRADLIAFITEPGSSCRPRREIRSASQLAQCPSRLQLWVRDLVDVHGPPSVTHLVQPTAAGVDVDHLELAAVGCLDLTVANLAVPPTAHQHSRQARRVWSASPVSATTQNPQPLRSARIPGLASRTTATAAPLGDFQF